MNREQKKKLGVLAVLGLALLVGGTFAFTAFNQQAINDRLRDNEIEVGGRVHDYYNRDTENKDVFVENFGQEPLIVRIRLSEFMEIQPRGESEFEPVVTESVREEISTWTIWKPEADDINFRQTGTDSAVFNDYANLTLGWERSGEFATWYLPTFNMDERDDRTAAAGHARDYFTSDATDGTTDGATHPGDGTDGYWSEGESYNNLEGEWFGSQVVRNTEQNLPQEKEPMTIQEWSVLPAHEKIGDFWVIDHQTGWAYWASTLEAGEATSYLLDEAEMKPAADAINGTYYYGINVSSTLLSLNRINDFMRPESGVSHHTLLGTLLEGIRNNGVDEGDENNPPMLQNSYPDDFIFSSMTPGRLFMMAGEQYRYLEEMGDGNHLIIRNEIIPNVAFRDQNGFLLQWFEELDSSVQAIIKPVVIPTTVPRIPHEEVNFDGPGVGWLPNNLSGDVAEDLTIIDEENGVKRAFSLSLADVTRLTKDGTFTNHAERTAINGSWWLRTPSVNNGAWIVNRGAASGSLMGLAGIGASGHNGVRPALIIHQ